LQIQRKGKKELQLLESDKEHVFFQAIPAYYTSAQSREYYALSETYAIEQQQQERQQRTGSADIEAPTRALDKNTFYRTTHEKVSVLMSREIHTQGNDAHMSEGLCENDVRYNTNASRNLHRVDCSTSLVRDVP
jgi:hypothetical protein